MNKFETNLITGLSVDRKLLKEWAHYYNVQNDDQNDDVECNVHSIFHSRYKLERYT